MYNNRGIVYLIISDYESAIKDFSRAIELMPGDSEAFKNRGFAYKKLADKSIDELLKQELYLKSKNDFEMAQRLLEKGNAQDKNYTS
ncbi:MAG: tetratricopeptide repeat protein [Spirochaetales bacterium]|nr:tetratricopeptide repeat protein [Spirochaetales bacterium]